MKSVILALALVCAASAAVVSPKGLLPVQPPELVLNRTEIPLNTTFLTGYFTLEQGATIYSLDLMTDTLTFNLLTFVVKGTITIPTVRLVAVYDSSALLTYANGTQSQLDGRGPLDASATGVTLYISVDMDHNIFTDKLTLKSIEADPALTGCQVDANGATSNGEPINFEAICAALPSGLAEFWAANGVGVCEALVEVGNATIFKDLTLADLIALIGGR